MSLYRRTTTDSTLRSIMRNRDTSAVLSQTIVYARNYITGVLKFIEQRWGYIVMYQAFVILGLLLCLFFTAGKVAHL